MKYQVISPVADVYGVPDNTAPRGKFETQLVFGETFIVSEENDGWCKGACTHDGYQGHIERRHLAFATHPTHIVTAARSHVYQGATMKSPFVQTLSFGSGLHATESDNGFIRINSGWVYQKHLAPAASLEKDPIATALKFLETPYYWGGRSGFGIDCSGLVQVALARAGINAPRDMQEQQSAIGAAAESPRGGDVVFFPGHVGIMTDARHIIHANAFHMKVTIEALETVIARGSAVTGIRRL